MTSENPVNPAPEAEAVSPELQDYVDNTAKAPEKQPDNSKAPEQVEPTDETPDGDGSEEKPKEPTAEPEAKGDEPEAPSEDETGKDPEDLNPSTQTYEVAGKTYESFDKAVAAVKKIAGDNTRMAGALKDLETQAKDYQSKYEEALRVNQEWQQYYEGKGESPATAESIKAAVEEIIAKKESEKSEASLKTQYEKEIEALPNEKDYDEIYPVMMQLAGKLGDQIKKISPKELYLAARGIKNESPAPDPSIDKVVEDTKEKMTKKQVASKVIGGGKGRATPKPVEEVSPELADYFANR